MLLNTIENFEQYINIELGLSAETLSAYKRDVQEFLDFTKGEDLTSQLIDIFILSLRQKGLVNTSIRRKIMSIRCYCHFLISIGCLDENILKMIDPVRVERKKPNAIESNNIDALISVVENRLPASRALNVRRDIAIILTLYHSGLRISELCNLNLGDINISRRNIRVMGKGRRERIVPTTIRCVNAICDYIDRDRLAASTDKNAVFIKLDGLRITRRSVGDMLRIASNTAGIKHTTPHLLRRSSASELMNRGMDLELIQSFLGHQSLSTTQSYLSISQDKLFRSHKQYHPFGEEYATR